MDCVGIEDEGWVDGDDEGDVCVEDRDVALKCGRWRGGEGEEGLKGMSKRIRCCESVTVARIRVECLYSCVTVYNRRLLKESVSD